MSKNYTNWNNKIRDPYIWQETEPSKQQDAISKHEIPVNILHINDPITNHTLIRLRNPKLAIKGFHNHGNRCINLHQVLKDEC